MKDSTSVPKKQASDGTAIFYKHYFSIKITKFLPQKLAYLVKL